MDEHVEIHPDGHRILVGNWGGLERLVCWGELIGWAIEAAEGKGIELLSCTLSKDAFVKRFDNGFGGPDGGHFTAWTAKRVYFPICYDGSEWVGSAPRDPCGKATKHQGG